MTKTCEHCNRAFQPRSAQAKFCSSSCHLLWRESQAKQSPEAVEARKKGRRNRLHRKWLRNEISGAEFEEQRAFWQRHGLWD